MLSPPGSDIVSVMKQLLLRVPDEMHRRLAARAERAGQSVNAVANKILEAAVDTDQGDRRTRLRARVSTLGLLRSAPAPAISPDRRQQIIASAAGLGPVVDQLLTDDRERT